MPFIVIAKVTDNLQATALVGDLAEIGIPRERVRVIPFQAEAEHRADPILAGGLRGAVLGGIVGAILGGILMLWWSLPWIGAAFGLLTGAICGGRISSNRIASHDRWFDFRSTRIEIDIIDPRQTAEVRRLCAHHRLRQIRLASPGSMS